MVEWFVRIGPLSFPWRIHDFPLFSFPALKSFMMRRRDFMQLVGCGLIGAPVLTNVFRPAELLAVETEDHAKLFLTEPYLQKPGTREMTIRWVTAKPCESWVEFGTTPELGQKAFTSVDGLKTSGRIQAITLTDLKPGTEYFYRAVSREITLHKPYNMEFGEPVRSPVKRFTTFKTDPTSTRFIMLNDIHNQPALWKSLVGLADGFPYEFAMLNGDMMNYIDDETHLIRDVLRPAGEIFGGRTPFYYVRGNHEARGAFARELKNYLTSEGDQYYYAQTIGPVRLVVLDSGEDKPDSHRDYFGMAGFDAYRETQRRWLAREIASPEFQEATYRVVVHHIPPLPGNTWTQSTERWLPLYEKGKVDLVLSGHTHKYSVITPSAKHSYAIVTGGGPQKGTATVLQIDANQDRLQATLLCEDGRVVGRFEKQSQ